MKVFMGKYPKNHTKERKVSIRIDKWDTWGMDHTLALIILPMLKQVKANKQGSPSDLPEFQQTDNQYPQTCFDFYAEGNDDAWAAGHKHWEEIMDKMIWSFEQVLDEDWDEQYWLVKPVIDWDDIASKEGFDEKGLKEIKWKVRGECDWDGRMMHSQHIREGLELFGKYYQDLWD